VNVAGSSLPHSPEEVTTLTAFTDQLCDLVLELEHRPATIAERALVARHVRDVVRAVELDVDTSRFTTRVVTYDASPARRSSGAALRVPYPQVLIQLTPDGEGGPGGDVELLDNEQPRYADPQRGAATRIDSDVPYRVHPMHVGRRSFLVIAVRP
jgi:hypothetical protein